MEQDNKNKLTKEQSAVLNDLYSNDESKIAESIVKLREKGGLYGIVPLMDIYFNTDYPEIRKSIATLFSDIKESKIAEIIIENLEKYKNSQYLSEFLSTLWQSSMKFENIKLFVDIFVNSDDKSAFECLTIIEQNIDCVANTEKVSCINLLKDNIQKLEGFKKDLSINLLEVLK